MLARPLALISVWATLFGASACSNPSPAIAQEAQESDSIHFHENYNEAIREAKLTQKPIFLEFRCAP